MFTINFILWLLGLGVVAVSLWLLFDEHLYLQVRANFRPKYWDIFPVGKKNIAMAYCDDLVKKCLKSADNVGSEDRLLPWHLHYPWHWLPGDYSSSDNPISALPAITLVSSNEEFLSASKIVSLKVTIMGFLGCCGAWKESPWMLGTVGSPCFFFISFFRLFLFVLQLFCICFLFTFFSQFFAFLMIIFFGEVASGVLVYYQVEEVFFKLNAK